MKMISFSNKKGGVGKTTLCENVAYKFALDGAKVLLIDLDPQANLTMDFFKTNDVIDMSLMDLISSKNIIKNTEINKIVKKSKYKNIDIIPAQKELTKSSLIIGTMYDKTETYIIADIIYQSNQEIFDSYDYVLIDYPPTINEMSLNWLILSDLILIPTNDAMRSFKGILDLRDNLNVICRQEKRNIPDIKIIFNNIKENINTATILNWLQKEELEKYISKTEIRHSDIFKTIENKLSNVWENQHYWRQKQAYEELIKEIK
ncbi:ParA family protein [Spiroplasma endosymbiont of Megaselia nigra]|uniref:ParA family protein n=1 Tax=Spiroplasma endosymbiont of Megaselia nigra TaxID=2478537 RepID=UPI000F8981C4|nr:AAA family ATPase [Spiroplasma endosymbiont of Megaselia nigra]RUO86604.1 hypothetical protein D9R21_02055 [Spiroplasma endosymbiont of Megaselia nigra]